MSEVLQSGIDRSLYLPGQSDTIKYGHPVLFNYDSIVSDSTAIRRGEIIGDFIIDIPGKFFISWWVATQSSTIDPNIGFAIEGFPNNGTVYNVLIPGVSAIKTGEVYGMAVIDIEDSNIPYKVNLMNITGMSSGNQSDVIIAQSTRAPASISIIELANNQPGPQGATGATGPTGPIGQQGPRGNVGARGEVGARGPAGERGAQGPAGARGADGRVGDNGPVGATGQIGPRGNTGATGQTGPTGVIGETGATGSTGEIGPAGATGQIGATGAKGDIGPSGIPNKISGVQYSILSSGQVIIPFGGALVFNSEIGNYNIESEGITEKSSIIFNGQDIVLSDPGIYDISWWLLIDGVDEVSEIIINIIEVVEGTPNYANPLVHQNFPVIITGQVCGHGVLKVTEPTTIRLVNYSTPVGIGIGQLSLTSNIDMKGDIKIISYTTGI